MKELILSLMVFAPSGCKQSKMLCNSFIPTVRSGLSEAKPHNPTALRRGSQGMHQQGWTS